MRLLLFSLLLLCQFSYACDCPVLSKIDKEGTTEYDIIFTGRVDSVTPCDGHAMAFFHIEQLYKGGLYAKPAIAFDCASNCLMNFEKGEQWIIYANVTNRGKIMVNICGHSRKYFAAKEKDYYAHSSGQSFEEENDFLKSALGIKAVKPDVEENKNPGLYEHENIQPSAYWKLWLLLISTVVFLLFYYLFNKYFK